MKILIVTILALFIAAPALAEPERATTTATAKTTTATTATASAQATEVQAAKARKPARKTHTAQGAADTIAAPPGTLATLCCGSLDPHSMAGENCAYMHTGQGCGGYILACPEGTTETVKQNGHGYCKDD